MRILETIEAFENKCGRPKIDTCIINNNWYLTLNYSTKYNENKCYDATFRFMNDYCTELTLYGKQELSCFEEFALNNKIRIDRWRGYD